MKRTLFLVAALAANLQFAYGQATFQAVTAKAKNGDTITLYAPSGTLAEAGPDHAISLYPDKKISEKPYYTLKKEESGYSIQGVNDGVKPLEFVSVSAEKEQASYIDLWSPWWHVKNVGMAIGAALVCSPNILSWDFRQCLKETKCDWTGAPKAPSQPTPTQPAPKGDSPTTTPTPPATPPPAAEPPKTTPPPSHDSRQKPHKGQKKKNKDQPKKEEPPKEKDKEQKPQEKPTPQPEPATKNPCDKTAPIVAAKPGQPDLTKSGALQDAQNLSSQLAAGQSGDAVIHNGQNAPVPAAAQQDPCAEQKKPPEATPAPTKPKGGEVPSPTTPGTDPQKKPEGDTASQKVNQDAAHTIDNTKTPDKSWWDKTKDFADNPSFWKGFTIGALIFGATGGAIGSVLGAGLPGLILGGAIGALVGGIAVGLLLWASAPPKK